MDMHKKVLLGCATLAASSMAFAGGDKDYDRELVMREDDDRRVHVEHEDEEEGFFELLIMGGIAAMDPENGSLYISEAETDSITNGSEGDWDSWTAQIGVGYVYPLDMDWDTGEVSWFPNVNPQFNVYYLDGTNMKGDVNLYQDPALNEASYNMDYNSTRLMFDLGVTVMSVEKLSMYVLGGLGVAFNKTQFDSFAKPGFDIADVSLESEKSTSFAYEFGGGLTYALMDDLAVSLEYLYTGITDVKLGDTNSSLGGDDGDDAFHINGSDIDVNSQALLLGLRLAI